MARRFREWSERMADRLARSSRVFLLGVVIACGVEVVNDWGATIGDINRLRANVRHKGENYVEILGRPSLRAVRGRDAAELGHLTAGLERDEDVAWIRYYEANGSVLFDHVRPDYEPQLSPHRALYDHLMDRDVRGMLAEPSAYKKRAAGSRYRDFAQVWSDATAWARSVVSKPDPTPPERELVLYQDRLRDEKHSRNDEVTWAIGVLHDDADVGAILVAFDMRRTNEVVQGKYLKGLGVGLFFVALIVVQNILARRDKLRLLDLETRYAGAKGALRAAIPAGPLEAAGVRVDGALDQAKGPVDGMVWCTARSGDLVVAMIADPDGDGIDAASVGLHVVKTFRARCAGGVTSLDDEVTALGAATMDIPLTRPIGVALVSIDPATRTFEARLTKFASLRVIASAAPKLEELAAPGGIVGPLFAARGTLTDKSLVICGAGLGDNAGPVLDADGIAEYLERAHAPGTPVPVDDAVTWTRGRTAALAENDIAIVAVSVTNLG